MPTITPQVTLNATLQDLSGGPSANSQLRIVLGGFGASVPVVAGTSILVQITQTIPFTGGAATVQLWGNDVISPAGTFYAIELLDPNGTVTAVQNYRLLGVGTFDLSMLTPYDPNALPGSAGIIYVTFAAGVEGESAPPVTFLGNYVAGTTYALSQAVLFTDGNYYVSLQAGNIGHTPSMSPTWWGPALAVAGPAGPTGPPVTFLGAWSDVVSYAVGQCVLYTDNSSYVSLQAANVNHVPSTTPAWWGLLAKAGPPSTFGGPWASGTTYALGTIVSYTDGASYVSLQNANTGNMPSSGSSFWGVLNPAASVPSNLSLESLSTPEIVLGGNTAQKNSLEILTFPTEQGYVLLVGDPTGHVYFAARPDGTIAGVIPAGTIQPNATDITFPGAINATGITTQNDAGLPASEDGAAALFLDENYNVIESIGFAGQPILSPYLNPTTINYFPNPPGQWEPFDPAAFSAILNHLTETGQSLSVGADAFPILSTSAPFAYNYRLGTTVNAYTLNQTGITLQPLFEQAATTGYATDGGETQGTSFASNIAALVAKATLSHPIVFSGSGWSGLPYLSICGPTDWVGQTINGTFYPTLTGGTNQGSPSFQNMMSQIATAKALTTGGAYAHRAAILIHGETDAEVLNANYGTQLVTWQRDIQNGSSALSGKSSTIPMLMTQCIYTFTGFQQLAVAMANPLTHTMVGPEYNIPHKDSTQIAAGADNLHLTSTGQRINGAYVAKAYAQRVLHGKPWIPLVPKSFKIAGNTIVITYWTNYQLVIDTSLVTDPGQYGFWFGDRTGATVIVGVAVTGFDQVTLTMNQPIALGGTRTLSYASDVYQQCPAGSGAGPNQQLGPIYGARGCLRNSDPTVSFFSETNPQTDAITVAAAPINLYDYGVAFSASI